MSDTIGSSSVPARRRRYAMRILLLLGVGVAAGAAWQWWFRPAPMSPPPLDSAGIDPMVWRAIDSARDAVRREPDSAGTWGWLGTILLAHQFRAEAVACLTQAEHLNPRDIRWPYYQALALYRADPEAAIAHLRRAVAADDAAMETPRLLLGELLVQCGQLEEANILFDDVLKRDPSNSRAHLGLAHVSFERDDLASSLAHLRQACANPCTRKAAHTFLAEVQLRRGDRGAAEKTLRQAQQLTDDAPWPDPLAEPVRQAMVGHLEIVTHAVALLRQDQVQEAIVLLSRAVEDYPESSWAYILLGRAWLRGGNLTRAEQSLRSAVRLTPEAVQAHFYLGVVHFERGEIAPAQVYFAKAVQLKPDYALAWYNLGHCRKRLGDHAGALTAFRTAVACQPQFAEARTNLGELLLRDGRFQDAVEQLRQAVDLAPQDTLAKRLLERADKRERAKLPKEPE